MAIYGYGHKLIVLVHIIYSFQNQRKSLRNGSIILYIFIRTPVMLAEMCYQHTLCELLIKNEENVPKLVLF